MTVATLRLSARAECAAGNRLPPLMIRLSRVSNPTSACIAVTGWRSSSCRQAIARHSRRSVMTEWSAARWGRARR